MKNQIHKIIYIWALLLPLLAFQASAQSTVVTGLITDAKDKDPLPYVTILFKGTSIVTRSDADGKFSISTSEKQSQIQFSFVGYKTKVVDIKPGETQNISVKLDPDATSLEAGITALGVWNQIIEFYPMIGTTSNHMLVKYKFKNNNTLTKLNNFDDTNVIPGKGLIWNTYQTSASRCLDMSITAAEMVALGGLGSFSYTKINPSILGAGNERMLYGANLNTTTTYRMKESLQNINAASDLIYQGQLGNALNNPATNFPTGVYRLFSKYKLSGANVSERKIFKDGILFNSGSSIAYNNGGNSENIGMVLGAIRNSAASLNYSFHGEMRLFMLHSAGISDSAITSIDSLMSNFINATGKQFV
nr:carboxypeptidase-like regulatory domain-containing protein [Pedobacter sp. ASV19]